MVKVPPKLTTFICKCVWPNTAVKLLVDAKDESDAWDKTWRKVSKMEGGDSCLKVVVVRQTN